MYYNSNKSNTAYYNAYKEEMANLEDYHDDEFSFQKVVKIGFIILALGVISIVTIYLTHYFSTTQKEEPVMRQHFQLKESKVETPKELQVNSTETQNLNENRAITKTTEVSYKDIALIVKIILAQRNHKKKAPLEE